MYNDPEYADTWRYTKEDRYVNGTQWEEDIPKGYDPQRVQLSAEGAIPDYDSYDYSGAKHWKFANDPFYASPPDWIDASPKGYDDYVHDSTLG